MIVDYIELLKMVKDGKIKDGDAIIKRYNNKITGTYKLHNDNFYLNGDVSDRTAILESICDYKQLFKSDFETEAVSETVVEADYHAEFKEIIQLLKEMRDKQ